MRLRMFRKTGPAEELIALQMMGDDLAVAKVCLNGSPSKVDKARITKAADENF